MWSLLRLSCIHIDGTLYRKSAKTIETICYTLKVTMNNAISSSHLFSSENQGHKLETAVNIKNQKKSRNYVKRTVNGSPQRWQLMKSNSISQTNNLRIPNYLF